MKKAVLLLGLLLIGFSTGSCEPTMCEDCYYFTHSDGSTEWTCIEYDCSTY